ncbi:MAG: hypothetical protein II819_04645 [Fibrobacter sp.]|nr:hypothetical protein [Fibrobacter sp.]
MKKHYDSLKMKALAESRGRANLQNLIFKVKQNEKRASIVARPFNVQTNLVD